MRARAMGGWSAGMLAGLLSLADARAALVKADGSPPVVMPNTLLVEAGERLGPLTEPGAPTMGRAVTNAKHSPRTCSAVAVRVAHQGTRIVTARHCADHRSLEVLDDDHEVSPIHEIDAPGEVDLSVLELDGKVPWPGLEMRAATSVAVGERLCAWRMHRSFSGIARERICGRLARREDRPGASALLVMNHPYPAGTSGSALVDREGRVVGIVVASTGLTGLAEPIEGVLDFPPPPTLAAATPSRAPSR